MLFSLENRLETSKTSWLPQNVFKKVNENRFFLVLMRLNNLGTLHPYRLLLRENSEKNLKPQKLQYELISHLGKK